jgi:putative drug exporter of the RND superfamily
MVASGPVSLADAGVLERLCRGCVRRRGAVVAAWVVALGVIGALMATLGGSFQGQNDFGFGGVEAERAHDLLAERFPIAAGAEVRIVWRAEAGVSDPSVHARMVEALDNIARLPSVAAVQSPYDAATPSISADGTIAFATVQFEAGTVEGETLDRLEALIGAVNGDGVQVAASGESLREFTMDATGPEAVGLLAATAILLVTFGSVVAMGLPLVTAIFSLGVGILGLSILAQWVDVPEFAPALATLLGLGAGIDYALLILTRHREGLHQGLTPEDAAVRALGTAGRAVLFAGSTVVVSLLGLLLVGIPFVRGMALASALAVGVTMLGALTLLPALLGHLGARMDRLSVPGLQRRESASHRASLWWRWSRIIQRRPVAAGVAGTAVLVVLALPLLSLQMGHVDAGNDPSGSLTRQGYELLAEGFGPGFNGPLVVVADLAPQTAPEDVAGLAAALGRSDGVAVAAPPQPSPDGSAALIPVIPDSAPQAAETTELLDRLRSHVIPAAADGTGMRVLVGGRTAVLSDTAELIGRRLPWFVGAVLVLSFLLLTVVFRSVLLPLKAVVVNLLSISAAYGVVVAVFQWGWGASLLGIERTGPIEAFFPLFLFAILFGLSMDYEVFILARVQEEYLRSGDNSLAVADGLAATARVVTAAAAIMVAIFGAVTLADNRILKLFGLGQGVAILIDAIIVRLVVVPAAMELMGRANWWLPPRLDRIPASPWKVRRTRCNPREVIDASIRTPETRDRPSPLRQTPNRERYEQWMETSQR